MSLNGTLAFTTSKRRMVDTKQVPVKERPQVAAPPQIYPKRYFDVAPTWFAWNKLTAADIHALRTERGFEGQKVFFYLNHPIQFVSIVGLLVEIELIADGKFTLLTLDDGSGECIVVKIKRRELSKDDEAEYPSNTEVDDVDVRVIMGFPTVFINHKPIGIGSVVKAKGTIETFRGIRQLELKRLFIIKDTNAEAKAWSQTAEWKRETLSRPWVLTQTQRNEVDEKIRLEERRDRDRVRRKREWDTRLSDKRRLHDEKHEAKRREKEVKYNEGALRGSSVILAPWE